MKPADAIEAFESMRIGAGAFRHRDHVRMVWNYLRLFPAPEALGRFSRAIRAFATHHGHPDKYHETVTWAYVLIVNERMASAPDRPWERFEADNPDLFVWPNGALSRYYSPEALASEQARTSFVMPDLVG